MSDKTDPPHTAISRLPAVPALTDMCFSEQLCLWSIRVWADHFRKAAHPHRILADAYRLAGAPGAMAELDGFMTVLVSGLHQPADIRCLTCPGISEDEFLMMEALALCQNGLDSFAEAVLDSLLRPASLRMGLPFLAAWAAAMSRAGHKIPFREWRPEISDPAHRRSSGRPGTGPTRPASVSLH